MFYQRIVANGLGLTEIWKELPAFRTVDLILIHNTLILDTGFFDSDDSDDSDFVMKYGSLFRSVLQTNLL